MISNRELRIGNLVTLSGSLILTVYEIHEDCFYAKDAKGSSFKNTWADLQPIPLSEEVLLKCGFENDETYVSEEHPWADWVKNDVVISLPYFEFNFESSEIEIKHLHQLQNLCYALTGVELEVKWS